MRPMIPRALDSFQCIADNMNIDPIMRELSRGRTLIVTQERNAVTLCIASQSLSQS
eukprot:m.42944 g.42944  ORF g.42944 m.42944 type:complete len:56 (+) comp8374_c0_seq2:1578-1745(+)